MKTTVKIGTRGSQLAIWQSSYVKQQLLHYHSDVKIELKIIKTTGDTIQDRSLIGLGKGVFTKEIEVALINKDIDLAVHSLKDLPTELPDGLCIAAIPTREDPRDVLVTSSGRHLSDLVSDARIGTTSPRRKSQLLHIRPDLKVVNVRGNVDTRLRKLKETDLDGIILAAAGLKRLQREDEITQYFETDEIIPAVGQGALAIETRDSDEYTKALLSPINDSVTGAEIAAERTVLESLGGGCQLPIGAYAKQHNEKLSLIGTVCHPEGRLRIVETATGAIDDPQELGRIVAENLRKNGADDLIKIVNIENNDTKSM